MLMGDKLREYETLYSYALHLSVVERTIVEKAALMHAATVEVRIGFNERTQSDY